MTPTMRHAASRLKASAVVPLLALCLLAHSALAALPPPDGRPSVTDGLKSRTAPARRLLQSTDPCAGYSMTSTRLSQACLTKLWAAVGCTTTAATSNAILPHYWTDPWWVAATYGNIKYDMLGWATSSDATRRAGCYGATTDPCAAYRSNPSLVPVNPWCLQNTWAAVGCTTTAATPNAILPHYWTDPWWLATTYSNIQIDMQGWATSSDATRRAGCYGGLLPSGPILVGYYETWSAAEASAGANMDLAKIPPHINVVVLSFAFPNCTYAKGSLSWDGTGLDFRSTGPVVRDAIAALKASNPNTRVLLGVGGASYKNFGDLNAQCVADIVADFGFDGADLDYEPDVSDGPGAYGPCTAAGGKVSCPAQTVAESVNAAAALRAALPKGRKLLSAATFHTGCYGEGAFAASQPQVSPFIGVNLAMARSPAGASLDLINVMAYDAGNLGTTGFDPKESLRAHRAAWPNAAIALGVQVPPEEDGGNSVTLAQVDDYAAYVKAQGAAGMMIWSLHKKGTLKAQDILARACAGLGMSNCAGPLPM